MLTFVVFLWLLVQPAWATVVGVVVDGDGARELELEQMIVQEVRALTSGEFDVQFPESKRRVGDWTSRGARTALDALLADPQVDIVLALGILASHEAARLKAPPKPVIAPLILDAALQELSFAATTQVKNLNVLVLPGSLDASTNEAFALTGQDLGALWVASPYREIFGDTVTLGGRQIPVQTVDPGATGAPDPGLGVVLLGPLGPLSADRRASLLAAIQERKLPSFALLDGEEVRVGALAGHGRMGFLPEVARRVAVHVQRVLFRDDPSTFTITVPGQPRLLVNLETARSIGFSPRWDDLFRATVLNPTAKGRPLDLLTAVREALDANLGLRGASEEVESQRHRLLEESVSQFLPQVEVGLGPTFIDQKTSDATLGMLMSRMASATVSVDQVLFAEPLVASVQIQRHLQTARESGLVGQANDLVLEVAKAYIDVLRARNFEEIRDWGLELTRVNLDLARTRQRLGVAGPGEVLRWESQFASSQADMIEASTQREAAERTLNRRLNRPLDDPFDPVDTDLVTGEGALLSSDALIDLLDTPARSARFVGHLVEDGLERSPLLGQLDASLAAQERALRSARLGRFLPTAGVSATFAYRFADNWKPPVFEVDPELAQMMGAMGIDAAGLMPEIEEMPEFQFYVAGQMSMKVFNGGQRAANIRRIEGELASLQTKRAAGAQHLEEGIRTSFAFLQAAWWKARRAEEAADAAERNLALAVNAYGQGAISILELLDAQSRAVTARLTSADANYGFRRQAWEVQHLVGRFELLTSDEERAAWASKAKGWLSD